MSSSAPKEAKGSPRKLRIIVALAFFAFIVFAVQLVVPSGEFGAPSTDPGEPLSSKQWRDRHSGHGSKNKKPVSQFPSLAEDDFDPLDIDFTKYKPPPPDNEYAVVHELPDGRQRIVANVSGVMVSMTSGIHFQTMSPLPPFIMQDLKLMQARLRGRLTVFDYPTPSSDFPFIVLGEKPVALYFPRILTDNECDKLIAAAKPRLQRSQVAPTNSTKSDTGVSSVRTSNQAWLGDGHSEVTRKVADRLKGIVGLKESEQTQILRYAYGQHYLAHHDFFDPLVFGPQRDNRAATFFLYLNTVPAEARGDTYFPRAFGRPAMDDKEDCTGGLSIFPKKGSGVLFYDQIPTGQLDPHSLHGSCAITNRDVVKWGGTKWFHSDTSRFGANPDAHAYK